MIISYPEYLKKTNSKDSRQSWIAWKVEICGMEPSDAIKAAYDPSFGWSPLSE